MKWIKRYKYPYYFSFYSKVINRKSCYKCHYRYSQRIEDLTFGDYWGIANYHNEFDVRGGVSAILVNTDKGAELLNAVKDQLQLSETKVENIARANNLTLCDGKKEYQIPTFREDFFVVMRAKGWKEAENKYLYDTQRIKLWIRSKIPLKCKRWAKKLIKVR